MKICKVICDICLFIIYSSFIRRTVLALKQALWCRLLFMAISSLFMLWHWSDKKAPTEFGLCGKEKYKPLVRWVPFPSVCVPSESLSLSIRSAVQLSIITRIEFGWFRFDWFWNSLVTWFMLCSLHPTISSTHTIHSVYCRCCRCRCRCFYWFSCFFHHRIRNEYIWMKYLGSVSVVFQPLFVIHAESKVLTFQHKIFIFETIRFLWSVIVRIFWWTDFAKQFLTQKNKTKEKDNWNSKSVSHGPK